MASPSVCPHYTRRCKLVCPTCEKSFLCRLCHNESETHEIDRFAVQQLQCTACGLQQPKALNCQGCQITFGKYGCLFCCLFDDAEKGQFHCDGCRLCRVGGRENFTHCDKCGFCLPNSLKETHQCIEEVSYRNCPVCLEDLHSSRIQSHIPPCSHLLHTTCFHNMLEQGLCMCPVCGKTMVNLAQEWAARDQRVNRILMPVPYRNLYCQILCKDCNKESITVFHLEGYKCIPCGSYNTTRSGGSLLKKKAASTASTSQSEGTSEKSIEEQLKLYESVDVEELDRRMEGEERREEEEQEDQGDSDEWETAGDESENSDFGEDQLVSDQENNDDEMES